MKNLILAAALLLAAIPLCSAATTLRNGMNVRIQASSIEGGWHTGRMHLDAQKCWMVKLDKPTLDHYTMLALIVVTELQVSGDGIWTPVGLKPVLQAQPAACREYGAD